MEYIKPSPAYFDEFLAACQESIDHHVTEWMPVAADDFTSWRSHALQTFEMLETGRGLPDGIPCMLTYWCVENDTFIGEIQIRPYLTEEEAMSIGHIGYAVRYSMWGKGYGAKLLSWAVEQLRATGISPVYIACHASNSASNKVSQKVGFTLLETRTNSGEIENLYVLDRA